jgi:SAM-dependent methyltransferase
VLDLCCGSGQLAARLAARGFQVTGVDGSAEMLRYARRNEPCARFVLADARSFRLPQEYALAVSVFDSLNHVTRPVELARVFENVYRALLAGGAFCFDMNTAYAFRSNRKGLSAIVQPDHAYILRRSFDPVEKMACWELTLYQLRNRAWGRSDVTVFEKIYTDREVRRALARAGFCEVTAYNAEKDLAMPGGQGRRFYLARRR